MFTIKRSAVMFTVVIHIFMFLSMAFSVFGASAEVPIPDYATNSYDGKLTPSDDVNNLLWELRRKLFEMNGAALYLNACYDRAAVLLKNLKENPELLSRNRERVMELRNELERMAVDSRNLHKDIDKNVGTLRRYQERLWSAFPRHRKTVDSYYDEMQKLRKKSERLALRVAKGAPGKVRTVDSLLGRTFDTYVRPDARPVDAKTANADGTSYEPLTQAPDTQMSSEQAPVVQNQVSPNRSRIEQLIAERLNSDKSGDTETMMGVDPEAAAEDKDMAAFLDGASSTDGVDLPPMMVDEPQAEQRKTSSAAAASSVPPLMVIEDSQPAATKAPVLKQPAKTPAKKPAVVSKPVSEPVKKPAPKPTTKPADDDGFGGFGGFDEEETAKPAPKPTKKPEPKPAPKPTKKPAADTSGDDGFDGFGGFGDDDEEPAKPAPKPTKKPDAKPANDASGDDDFEGFMDFDEGRGSFGEDSVDVADSGKRDLLFSEQIAMEFKRAGISSVAAAPPVTGQKQSSGPALFADTLQSELASGLPSANEILKDDTSSSIAALLSMDRERGAVYSNAPVERARSNQDKIKELLKKLKGKVQE